MEKTFYEEIKSISKEDILNFKKETDRIHEERNAIYIEEMERDYKKHEEILKCKIKDLALRGVCELKINNRIVPEWIFPYFIDRNKGFRVKDEEWIDEGDDFTSPFKHKEVYLYWGDEKEKPPIIIREPLSLIGRIRNKLKI